MVRDSHSQTVKLGKKISSRRKKLGMTQEQLAEKLGVVHQALSRIEQGHTAPKMDRLPAIAQALQCTVSDLFRDEAETDYASRMEDLLSGLSNQKKEYVFHHLSSLVFLLKSEDA